MKIQISFSKFHLYFDWIDFFSFFFHQKVLSSVQSLSHVGLFKTPWTAACQAFLSITDSQNLLKLMSIKSMMPSNHLILCHPFSSHFQFLPASGSFPMSQFFASGSQSIVASASASVLPMNIQDWYPLRLTCWIALQSKGLSRVFSNTTVRKHHETQLWCQKVWELLVYSTQGYGVLKGRTHYLNETTCLQVLYILGDILYIQPHQTPA